MFANLLKKSLKNKFSDILILSKDLFLYPREKRIKITRNLRKITKNQNELHYDLKKLKLLLEFLNRNKDNMIRTINNKRKIENISFENEILSYKLNRLKNNIKCCHKYKKYVSVQPTPWRQ